MPLLDLVQTTPHSGAIVSHSQQLYANDIGQNKEGTLDSPEGPPAIW